MTNPSRSTNADSAENSPPPQLPRFADGDLISAADMNRLVDAVNYLLRIEVERD